MRSACGNIIIRRSSAKQLQPALDSNCHPSSTHVVDDSQCRNASKRSLPKPARRRPITSTRPVHAQCGTRSDWLQSIKKRKIIIWARKNIRHHYYPTMFVWALRLSKNERKEILGLSMPKWTLRTLECALGVRCVTTQAENLQCPSRKKAGSTHCERRQEVRTNLIKVIVAQLIKVPATLLAKGCQWILNHINPVNIFRHILYYPPI
jgi:hypothetical protein